MNSKPSTRAVGTGGGGAWEPEGEGRGHVRPILTLLSFFICLNDIFSKPPMPPPTPKVVPMFLSTRDDYKEAVQLLP